ncbi:ABC transporter permease [Lachnoclostridium sp. An169]|nr:ABC transporter permease [Lachnoclostridium sp. An169]HJA66630.1 ABC transporter permease [Candidatus Mediterraneibacter cottocaccae]
MYFSIILVKRLVKMMLLFEIKKVLSKPVNKIALLILAITLAVVSYFAVISVSYTDENGSSFSGPAAAVRLREEKNKWAGRVTEDVLKKVLQENSRINQSPEYLSTDVTQNNIAYSEKQGFSDIREMINFAFSDFQEYDYYRADKVSESEVGKLYENRIESLKTWLSSNGISERWSQAEKDYLIRQFDALDTPLYYEYSDGWRSLLEYAPTLIMFTVLIAGFLVSGIFPGEFTLKADSIYFSCRFGRDRAVRAKIGAGFVIVSAVYWIMILGYSLVVLLSLGAGGGGCAIQAGRGWKSFYNITCFQEYLLTIFGGYVGILFVLGLAMLISAKTRSAVFAVTIPFIILFVPSILTSMNILTGVLGFFPDQLLQIPSAVSSYNLLEIGVFVTGAVPVLFVLYLILYGALLPVTYRLYRKSELR